MDDLFASHNPVIFVGAAGSGKTEWALNTARYKKERGRRPIIIDLDVVKPYFRSREYREHPSLAGVAIVSSVPGRERADVPALSPSIGGLLRAKAPDLILDVGGGEGAIVLGQYVSLLQDMPYGMWLVVNTRRPFARNLADLTATRREIESAARLPLTGIIANTNLGDETDEATILEGFDLVRDYARELRLPICAAGVPLELKGADPHLPVPVFYLKRHVCPPWEQE